MKSLHSQAALLTLAALAALAACKREDTGTQMPAAAEAKVLNVASVSRLAEALERIDDGAFAGGPRGR